MQLAKLLPISTVLLMLVPCAYPQRANVSTSSLNFPPQVISLVDSGSQPQTVIVTNTGTANLVISSVVSSGGYKQVNTCSTLPPNQSCTIEVTFNPGTLGTINGAITINDNAPSSPQVVSLSGTSLAPAQLSPRTVSFGAVALGGTSQPKAVTLTAAANSSFSINQISVSGDFAQLNNCPSSLQGGQSCTIQVVFHPTVNKAVTGALAVSTAVGNTPLPFSVALTGSGTGNVVSHIALQPATLNFGNKGPDSVDSIRAVTLTNTSTMSMAINNVSLSGSPNAVGAFPLYKINSNTCAGMLAPSAQCTIEIAFSTTFSRVFPLNYPAALTIFDSDPTSPQVIGISGNEVMELTFHPTSVVFAPQPVGTTTTKMITVTGNDLEAGLVLDVAVSGNFSASGDLAPCLFHLAATCTMTVSFTPQHSGAIKGAVTLETYPECNPFPLHHCSDPVVLNLSGTGR